MDEQFYSSIRLLFAEANGRFGDADEYVAALSQPPKRGLRLNPLKTTRADFLRRLPYALTSSPFSEDGFLLDESVQNAIAPGLNPFHAAGLYYMQEPSAMLPVSLLLPVLAPFARVLDLCAAPGGKTTQLLGRMPQAAVVANEIVFARAKILMGNVERMGARNCAVTCARPDELAAKMPGAFDAVIADVPCSGEGMFRKEAAAVKEWREKNVAACVNRGREILASAMALLKPGGYLVYSTCTLNKRENEEQLAWLTANFDCRTVPPPIALTKACDAGLAPACDALRVFPHRAPGEGHFACLIRKNTDADRYGDRKYACDVKPYGVKDGFRGKQDNYDKFAGGARAKADGKLPAAIKDAFLDLYAALTDEPLWAQPTRQGDGLYLCPDGLDFVEGVPLLRKGVRAADLTDGRIAPHHQLAKCLNGAKIKRKLSFAPESGQIYAYLAGEEFLCGEKNGYTLVQADGLTLGFAKITDGTAKNRYPKGLRYRLPR